MHCNFLLLCTFDMKYMQFLAMFYHWIDDKWDIDNKKINIDNKKASNSVAFRANKYFYWCCCCCCNFSHLSYLFCFSSIWKISSHCYSFNRKFILAIYTLFSWLYACYLFSRFLFHIQFDWNKFCLLIRKYKPCIVQNPLINLSKTLNLESSMENAIGQQKKTKQQTPFEFKLLFPVAGQMNWIYSQNWFDCKKNSSISCQMQGCHTTIA